MLQLAPGSCAPCKTYVYKNEVLTILQIQDSYVKSSRQTFETAREISRIEIETDLRFSKIGQITFKKKNNLYSNNGTLIKSELVTDVKNSENFQFKLNSYYSNNKVYEIKKDAKLVRLEELGNLTPNAAHIYDFKRRSCKKLFN